MTREGALRATRSADTEVFYMAGKQLAALSRQLIEAGWPGGTPVSVVSRAGWPDSLHSEHSVVTLPRASMLHAGRPTIAIVGAGAGACTLDATQIDPLDSTHTQSSTADVLPPSR